MVQTKTSNWISADHHITENHRRFYTLLPIDRFSKWPAANFCKHTDGETPVKLLEQYIQLHGKPKTILTDKATAFERTPFSQLLYETIDHINIRDTVYTYSHRPCKTGSQNTERKPPKNTKAGEYFEKALDMSLDVIRKMPHTRLNKSAFELHNGWKPNTKISKPLKVVTLEKLTKNSTSAKPDTLQVYSFNGVVGVPDQLPMKPM